MSRGHVAVVALTRMFAASRVAQFTGRFRIEFCTVNSPHELWQNELGLNGDFQIRKMCLASTHFSASAQALLLFCYVSFHCFANERVATN